MDSTRGYELLADALLLCHFAFVSFIALGLVAIWVGHLLGAGFVRNFCFRMLHLGAMSIVLVEALFGILCPFTTWEVELRRKAGRTIYSEQTFMQHWVHKLMFFDLSESTFTLIYGCFFVALLSSLVWIRPDRPAWLTPRFRPDRPC